MDKEGFENYTGHRNNAKKGLTKVAIRSILEEIPGGGIVTKISESIEDIIAENDMKDAFEFLNEDKVSRNEIDGLKNNKPDTTLFDKGIITIDDYTIKDTNVCIGREKKINEVLKVLSEKNIILLHGMGGIGKTKICQELYKILEQGKEFKYFGWLKYSNNYKDTVLDNFPAIENIRYGNEDSNKQKEKYIKTLKTKISKINENADGKLLLIIDNVEEPKKEDLDFFKGLSSPNCKILFTSREKKYFTDSGIEQIEIEHLERDDCIELFKKEYFGKSEYGSGETTIISIIVEKHAILHTLLIILLARTARFCDGDNHLPKITKLKDELDGAGIKMIHEKVGYKNESTEYDATTVCIEHIASVFARITKLKKSEKQILKNISLFPYQYLQAGVIKEWLNIQNAIELHDLYEKGWLQWDGTSGYKMHPAIAESIRCKYPPTFEDCKALIEVFSKEIGLKPNGKIQPKYQYVDFYISVSNYFCNEKQAVNTSRNLIRHLAHVFYNKNDEFNKYLVDLNLGIGRILKDQSKYDEKEGALKYHDSALRIAKKTYKKKDIIFAMIYAWQGIVFYLQKKYEQEAFECFEKAIKICEKHEKNSNTNMKQKEIMASVYNHAANNYRELAKNNLSYYEKALKMLDLSYNIRFDMAEGKDTTNTMFPLYNKGRVLLDRERTGDIIDAKNIFDRVLKFREENEPDNEVQISETKYYFAKIYLTNELPDTGKAIALLENVITIREKDPKGHEKFAITLETLGDAYVKVNDKGLAISNYELAISRYNQATYISPEKLEKEKDRIKAKIEKLIFNPLSNKSICFLGSSVTYGYASDGLSFVDFIGERNNCVILKNAVSGTTLVDDMPDSYIKRLEKIDKKEKIDIFICQLSTNDAKWNKELGNISQNTDFDTKTIAGAIEYIINYAKQNFNCKIAFYTSPQFENSKYDEMVKRLLELKSKWNIYVIDLWNDFQFNEFNKRSFDRYMLDPIHPTKEGYSELWTPYFEKNLQSILISE